MTAPAVLAMIHRHTHGSLKQEFLSAADCGRLATVIANREPVITGELDHSTSDGDQSELRRLPDVRIAVDAMGEACETPFDQAQGDQHCRAPAATFAIAIPSAPTNRVR